MPPDPELTALVDTVLQGLCGDPKCVTHRTSAEAVVNSLVTLAKQKPLVVKRALGL